MKEPEKSSGWFEKAGILLLSVFPGSRLVQEAPVPAPLLTLLKWAGFMEEEGAGAFAPSD